ncbi:MAG: MGMT family protein [bacterium]
MKTTEQKYMAIWDQVKRIQKGQIASYGEIAKRAGLPRHARLVSSALKEAPEHMNLPWYRVVGSGPKISLPLDSENGKYQKQKLREEGHLIKGRLIKPLEQEQENLDYLLWGPD